jgi:hypothetical protein
LYQKLLAQLSKLLSGPLNWEDAESVQWMVLSELVIGQNVRDRFTKGIWNVLGRALEFFEPFATKVVFLRAMYQLIVHAEVKEIVDVLGQIERYPKMEGNDEWMGKIFKEQVIDLLIQVRETRPETHKFILADSLLARVEET